MIQYPNPYERNDAWYFYDETGDEHGPYSSEKKALKNLLAYCYFLDHGPTLWQRVWWPIRRWIT